MDVERFERELPHLFERFPESSRPRDRRFEHVLEAVPGLARENNLALLNLAARLLGLGESYVEVGSFRGTSLVAAMLGNDGEFVAIDDFSFDEATPEGLESSLERFGLEGATILAGNAFELLERGALEGRSVGVYYYDAAHDHESQLRGLRLVEPHLAHEALLIVDDSDWDEVRRATADYLAGQPQARLAFDIPGSEGWWEGMQVISWLRA
ncbi:MAG TPA: class I SAM-dependent methyltransferase [Gaiellaceae bacterium]|nr:class I SAM-dependent methyltransferase [Gaiellaceae bacterium]